MLTIPMDVLEQFPIRKSKQQKQAFRDAVKSYAEGLGYQVSVEKGSMGAKNVVIGDPEKAKYLVTAHYDTPARMFLPNFITPCNFLVYLLYNLMVVALFFLFALLCGMVAFWLTEDDFIATMIGYFSYWIPLVLMMAGPANRHNSNDNTSGVVTVLEILTSLPESHRDQVCFVLFDLEEAGLVGSASYRKAHKAATEQQLVLNLDCVGDGEAMMMFPTKKLKENETAMAALEKITGQFGERTLDLHKKGFAICPSDHANFPLGVGIMAFRVKKLLGLYCDKIHTDRDRTLEMTNVNILRAALITLICQ